MNAGTDGVQAQNFACHMKAHHMLFAMGVIAERLELAAVNNVQTTKRLAYP